MATKYHAVPCTGLAHENPYIDHCFECAPRWGSVMVPVYCGSLDDWREHLASLSTDDRARQVEAQARATRVERTRKARNAHARERAQAMRDLGMKRTRSGGWE